MFVALISFISFVLICALIKYIHLKRIPKLREEWTKPRSFKFNGVDLIKKIFDTHNISLKDVPIEVVKEHDIGVRNAVAGYANNSVLKIQKIVIPAYVLAIPTLYTMFVSAHEAFHAVQHKERYKIFLIQASVNYIGIGTGIKFSFLLSIIGYIISNVISANDSIKLLYLIVMLLLYLVRTLEYLIFDFTMEYNCDKRAVKFLKENNYFSTSEMECLHEQLKDRHFLLFINAFLFPFTGFTRLWGGYMERLN